MGGGYEGRTPLMQALHLDTNLTNEWRLKIARVLLDYGADLNAQDTSGRTIFDYTLSDSMEKLLKEYRPAPTAPAPAAPPAPSVSTPPLSVASSSSASSTSAPGTASLRLQEATPGTAGSGIAAMDTSGDD